MLLRIHSPTAAALNPYPRLWHPHSHQPTLPWLHLLPHIKFVKYLTVVQLRIRPKDLPAGSTMRNSSRFSFTIAHVILMHVRNSFSGSHLLSIWRILLLLKPRLRKVAALCTNCSVLGYDDELGSNFRVGTDFGDSYRCESEQIRNKEVAKQTCALPSDLGSVISPL